MMKRSMIAVVSVLVLSCSLAVAAQTFAVDSIDDELAFLEAEYTVESASRYVQKISEAPASVTVITSEMIKRYGFRNIDDVLKSIIGLYVTNDRNYSYLGVRGFGLPADYNSRVLFMVDGHRMNDALYSAGGIGWEVGLDLDAIERIEVVRGPASALYGTNAQFGIINYVTKKAKDHQGSEARLMLGEPGLIRGSADVRGVNGDFSFSLNVNGMKRDGHDELYYPELTEIDYDEDGISDYDGFARDQDEESVYGTLASATWGPVTLTGKFYDRDKVVPTASFETIFNSGEEKSSDSHGYLDLSINQNIGDSFSFLARIAYDQYDYTGKYPYDYDYEYADASYVDPPYTINKDDETGKWITLEFQGIYDGLKANRILFGASYVNNDIYSVNFDDDPYIVNNETDLTFYGVSGYIQDEIELAQFAHFVAGINYNSYDSDVYQGEVDRLNPRAALVLDLGSKAVLKALYGEAFRVPNMYELYYDDGGAFMIENPELESEIMKTAEVIFEYSFTPAVTARASGYMNRLENLIMAEDIGDDLMQFNNQDDDIVSRGIELELKKAIGKGFSGFAAVAFQETVNDETDEVLPNSPEVMANAGISVPLFSDKIFCSIDAHYMGERENVYAENVDPYVITNVTLFAADLLANLEISLSAYNVFDEEYSDPGSFDHLQVEIPQDGRNFGVQVRYRF